MELSKDPPGMGPPGRARQAWARYAKAFQAETTHVDYRPAEGGGGDSPSKGLQRIV